MNILTDKVGRILFALPFVVFGLFHFMDASNMAENVVPGWMPLAIFWVYLTGLALIAAGASIILEKKVRMAGILLGVMLLVFVLALHIPGVIAGNEASMPNLLKDAALAGAAWNLAGQYDDEKDASSGSTSSPSSSADQTHSHDPGPSGPSM